jgi:hypothetical protein
MTRKAYPPMQCPSCSSEEVLRVAMTLGELPVEFSACNACEWKGWARDGRILPLSSVLPLITRR